MRLGVQDYLIKDAEDRMFEVLPLVLHRLVRADRLEKQEIERQHWIKAENARRKALLDSLPLGVMFLDRDQRVLEMNQTALDMTGQEKAGYRGDAL